MLDRRSAIAILATGLGEIPLLPYSIRFTEASADTLLSEKKRLDGYKMPSEAESHERTIMQWPVNRAVYDPKSLAAVQHNITLIANTISQFEPVVMLVSGADAAYARKRLSKKVEIWDIQTDDLWARDSGPTFVKNANGELAVAHIKFNGWGNKQPHRNDSQISGAVAKRLGMPFLSTGLIGEQGGIEHDGEGTLLAHASCWVNTNRNKGTNAAIGQQLQAALGGEKIIWAPGIKGADITDYHIDALARFVAPGKVLIQLPAEIDRNDPWSISAFETYQILKQSTDSRGRPLEIIIVPEPVDIRSHKIDFVASYVNFYICNNAVICAEFGDREADEVAASIIRELYPDREVVSINIDAIGEAGGGIHCATQQQPRAG